MAAPIIIRQPLLHLRYTYHQHHAHPLPHAFKAAATDDNSCQRRPSPRARIPSTASTSPIRLPPSPLKRYSFNAWDEDDDEMEIVRPPRGDANNPGNDATTVVTEERPVDERGNRWTRQRRHRMRPVSFSSVKTCLLGAHPESDGLKQVIRRMFRESNNGARVTGLPQPAGLGTRSTLAARVALGAKGSDCAGTARGWRPRIAEYMRKLWNAPPKPQYPDCPSVEITSASAATVQRSSKLGRRLSTLLRKNRAPSLAEAGPATTAGADERRRSADDENVPLSALYSTLVVNGRAVGLMATKSSTSTWSGRPTPRSSSASSAFTLNAMGDVEAWNKQVTEIVPRQTPPPRKRASLRRVLSEQSVKRALQG